MEYLSFYIFYGVALSCVSSIKQDRRQVIYKEHEIVKRQTRPPENETTISDDHAYYTSKIISDPDGAYWNELEGHTKHILSNDHHLRYSFVIMSFQFPFYGHPINRFAITTQGFLYMSNFTHPDLDWTFTHYIAPLMGNFDTIGNDSQILYKDNGHSFVVEWRNVELNDQPEKGAYTYQATLFENGTILLAYKSIPDTNISGQIWPVKVGISDAYYYDRDLFFGYIRYIVRYHNITLNVTDLGDNTVVVLDPLPTCNKATTCEDCTSLNIGFNCSWCHAVSRCSDGIDRHMQEWSTTGCVTNGFDTLDQCTIPTTTTSPTPTIKLTTTTKPTTTKPTTRKPTITRMLHTTTAAPLKPPKSDAVSSSGSSDSAVVAIPIVLFLVIIVVLLGVWIYYARTHPNTRSGMWLIENSPRRIKEKISEITFFKNSSKEDGVCINSKYEIHENTSKA
ncbi:plexin domain-containing protein 2-like [Mytilus californianus]|uniref:plexin domain-containing protein 2-like n=1 Tax=Mytilus californianus TaxID=6549 RepID=UPI0022456BEB|nr:plexin domain-containing protein 2-like [Mytilus californianus]